MDAPLVTKLTVGLLVFSLVIIGAWDVYLALSKITAETPSEVILTFLSRYPIIAVLVGVILGHLVWPQYK